MTVRCWVLILQRPGRSQGRRQPSFCARVSSDSDCAPIFPPSDSKRLGKWRAPGPSRTLQQAWNYRYEGSARKFFETWFGWASRSKLKPHQSGENDQAPSGWKISSPICAIPSPTPLPKHSTAKSNPSSPTLVASVPFKTTAPESSSSVGNSASTHYKTGRTSFSIRRKTHTTAAWGFRWSGMPDGGSLGTCCTNSVNSPYARNVFAWYT